MAITSRNLLRHIKDTISWIANRKPDLYQLGNNYVAIFWEIRETQDSIYEMFNSKDDMEFYYIQVKQTFEQEYPRVYLDVKYSYGPVDIEDIMYSRIVFHYYDKSYENIMF